MEINTLMKTIQDFFDDNTLTIVGSGLSCAEGLPGMNELAKHLINSIDTKKISKDLKSKWEIVEKNLRLGLEAAMQSANLSAADDLTKIIRQETAWYIRNAESKVINEVLGNSRTLRFSSFINKFNLSNSQIKVITTNYDRLIELACELEGIRANTMFVGTIIQKLYSETESKYSTCIGLKTKKQSKELLFAKSIQLYKPHGCLSWYSFRESTYSIPYLNNNDCLIITPGSAKYRAGYDSPFNEHRNAANSNIDKASRYIIIGYGFNDDHLETSLRKQIMNGRPTLIITYELNENTKELVLNNKCNIISLSRKKEKGVWGTEVYEKGIATFFKGIEWWDIKNLVGEVFDE